LIEWQYNLGNDSVKEVDDFEGTVSLSWEKVAGRELPLGEDDFIEEGYRGFEMTADSGRYIVVSLQVKSNVPYIVFSVNSRIMRLSNGDAIDLLFENDFGEKNVLTFPITRNYVDGDTTKTDHAQYCFDDFLDCNKFADGQPSYTYVFLK
jgi:hypothetical protein